MGHPIGGRGKPTRLEWSLAAASHQETEGPGTQRNPLVRFAPNLLHTLGRLWEPPDDSWSDN